MRSALDARVHGAALAAVAAAMGAAPSARADGASGGLVDPSYGRVDGDVTAVVGAGAAVVAAGPRVEAELRLRYLETAGWFATYEDAPVLGSAAAPPRVVTSGVELRPLFLFRWLEGYETSRARLDLAVDSLAIELGATFAPGEGAGASSRGFFAGVGFEVPLGRGARGPWVGVRGALRWTDEALALGGSGGSADPQAVLVLTVAWHEVVVAHLVDVGDRAPP